MAPYTRHANKGFKRKSYANEWFDTPHPIKPLEIMPKGSEWPGLKVPKPNWPQNKGKGDEMIQYEKKPMAPAELRPRKRRTQQEI